jgi:predicted CoA-substrate-specific enzyme activase
MRAIGFDFGSIYSKAVLLDGEGNLALACYAKNGHDDWRLTRTFFAEAAARYPCDRFPVGVSGIDPDHAPPGVYATNAIIAVGEGVQHLHPGTRTLIEIGGHTSKVLVFAPDGMLRDFTTNDACAAGTGAFLEQQARRLGLGIEDLSRLGATAQRPAPIAGRCAMFAKTDMIHLQQKGTPVEELCLGLCTAIARNALATLLRGADPSWPIVLAGGCARNAGVLRAFREVLGLRVMGALTASAYPGLEGAIGAAIGAARAGRETFRLDAVRQFAATLAPGVGQSASSAHPRLDPQRTGARAEEPLHAHDEPCRGWLGVDVGSVSTDFVVLDSAGTILTSVYLPTRGNPVDALREGLAILNGRFRGGLDVLGCAVTGSGRHLAAKLFGADIVKNEIVCQMLGAQAHAPGVDTIIEIGGQDSKFIAVANGGIADFAMNKVCAAGTGSFLEEQAEELGVDIYREFAAQAFASEAPSDLGSRCTVFMETEVVNAVRRGVATADACAGLAYAIAENYLTKVVGGRPLGRTIVFQGGVASNDAVAAAFEKLIGRPVQIHPYNRLSGAIGAAIAARNAMARGGGPSTFRGLDPGPRPRVRSFECTRCSNRCEVNAVESAAGQVFFGDTCERYTSRGDEAAGACPLPNLAEEYLAQSEAFFQAASDGGPVVGIPRASTLMAHLPFWATIFRELGARPVLSRSSSQTTLALGLKHLPVPVCLPIKLMAGHAHALLGEGVDAVFVPSVMTLPGDDPATSHACPYAMAVPFMIGGDETSRFLAPIISFVSEDEFVEGFAGACSPLAYSRQRIRAAYRSALRTQQEFEASLRRRGEELRAAGGFRHLFAVLGKPYNTFDAFLNLRLFERLRRMGVLALPLAYLSEDAETGSDLPWRFSADIHRAAMQVARTEGVVPVIVSNFGCGPDAFTYRRIETPLRDTPHLVLEFDEHRGEAGLITRLEAFLDRIAGAQGGGRRFAAPVAWRLPARGIPAEPADVRIPYFADHAYAFSGLWRFKGHRAEVLPPAGAHIRALGEKYTPGKECHPYAMIAGDLVNLSREAPHGTLVFYIPGTAIPCLLREYGAALQLLLRELNIDNITISSPTGKELYEAFGIEAIERFYMGLLAIEILAKALCEVRPYETARGAADAVHRESLRRIEAAIAGGDIVDALDRSLQALLLVPAQRERSRPLVGIAGDVYTKVNPAANNDLYRWLEDRGLEVWPSPFQIDLLNFGISRQFFESASKLRLLDLLVDGSIALKRLIREWEIQRVAADRIARLEEPGYLEMRRLAAPYMPNEAHPLLFLNTVKIVDFARRGADGIINAICFNCMVGNASAAVLEKIRRDYQDIPIVTAVYSGGEDPARRMVLEAFVHQVKTHHRTRHRQSAGL